MFKNKKIVLTILLIFIIAIISFFIGTNVANKSIIRNKSKEAEKLTETNQDNSYITTADHLSEVNASIAKLTEFKKEIANAITEMGVATAENADADTMASNIRSLSGNSSSDSEIRRYSYSWTSSNNEQKTLTLEVEPKYISFTVDGIRLNATLYDVENQEYIINTTGANIITSVNGKVVTINTWHDSTQVNYLCYW